MKCCRTCHYFESGMCYNKKMLENFANVSDIYSVAEEGRLDGVLEETLHSCGLESLEFHLCSAVAQWGLSKKRQNFFSEDIKFHMNKWLDEKLKPMLDVAISKLYQNAANEMGVNGIEIADPAEFCCNQWE